MNIANYTRFDRYPLSVESLDFIQEQIKLIYNICELYGQNYILRQPTGSKEGILIKDGEVLPIQKGAPAEYIVINTTPRNVVANGQNFAGIETVRIARYTSSNEGSNCYAASGFEKITSISDINKNMKRVEDELNNNLATVKNDLRIPKGGIIMWSGITDEKSPEFPPGFRICDGRDIPGYGKIPDLRGRFIVGYDSRESGTPSNTFIKEYNYGAIGNTGGLSETVLSVNEMPNHNHISSLQFNKLSAIASDFATHFGGTTGVASSIANSSDATKYNVGNMKIGDWGAATMQPVGGSQSHENRPPYYVLAYLIKVI